jgi:pantoate--beta-alanine ligase
MYIFSTAADLSRFLRMATLSGRDIGFVPTMGALHQGHLSLINYSLQQTSLTVCSIFVNPTQFNDPSDLLKYPRTPQADIALLARSGCQVLFMPDMAEIYPQGTLSDAVYDFGILDQVMEATFRPGHFQGVAQVVKRLLDIVKPDFLFMGQKDFQQTAIVAAMLRQTNSSVALHILNTVREPDGLAMSSRNQRLTPEFRTKSLAIYQALTTISKTFGKLSVTDIRRKALQTLELAGLNPEYVEIVHRQSLLPLSDDEQGAPAVACVAAWAGEVRLIDNMLLM